MREKDRNFKDDGNIPQEILDFIEANRGMEISLEEYIQEFTNKQGLHNHTFENLFLYFHLEKVISKNRLVVYPNAIFIVDNRRHKIFINDNENFLRNLDFSWIKDEKLKKKFTIYSSVEQNISKDDFNKSKSKELVYDLDYALSEESFYDKYSELSKKKVKKKIYNRLTYPEKYLDKIDFKEKSISIDNLSDALEVHEKWVEWKQNNPDVFQMMFSSNRYNQAIIKMFDHDYLERKDFYAKVFYLDGKPFAVRHCLIKGNRSYDIGFFSLYWDLPSNLINYLNTYCLQTLNQMGIKYHNCGMLFDKKNSDSKNHYSGELKIIYTYKNR